MKWIVFTAATIAIVTTFFLVKDPPLEEFEWNHLSNSYLDSIVPVKEGRQGKYKRLHAKSDLVDLFAKAIKTTNEIAMTFAKDQNLAITGLYQSSRSPYRGAISQKISCQKELTPAPFNLENKELWIKGLKLRANKRFVYSGCSPKQATRDALWITVYCKKQKQLIELKLFFKKTITEKHRERILNNFSCFE